MNIVDAICNLVRNPILELVSYDANVNRANAMGDALEEYVKDLFAGTFGLTGEDRNVRLGEVFSYLGNANNPPDMMLKGGDAIEVKKIQSYNSALALNSSYPKQVLSKESPMLSSACRKAEDDWKTKDMIYVVGCVDETSLKHLVMVYGLDYCANDECYRRIRSTIKDGVESIPGVDFSESKELGHINKVDPLGITYMRIRGMWGIENPWKVFDYVYQRDPEKSFNFMCLINETKWNSLGNTDRLTALQNENFSIKDVKIKNPDNPAQQVKAKLISYVIG